MKERRSVLEIPIFHKAYTLYKMLSSYHNQIPKSQRYTLWQRCENTSLSLLEEIIRTNHRRGKELSSNSVMATDIINALPKLFHEFLAHHTPCGEHSTSIEGDNKAPADAPDPLSP